MTARTKPASWRAHDEIRFAGRHRTRPPSLLRELVAAGLLAVVLLGLAACGGDDDHATSAETDPPAETAASTDGGDPVEFSGTLRIGAIPDQDPEVLQRQFGLVSDRLAEQLGVQVEYVPVTDYQGAVSGFAVGDLDLVWFGGLTGVQARLEVEGAQAILQRDIDAEFTSVFIAGADVGIEPFDSVDGLTASQTIRSRSGRSRRRRGG
jgi:phosphonate transport system substrate-binding protein